MHAHRHVVETLAAPIPWPSSLPSSSGLATPLTLPLPQPPGHTPPHTPLRLLFSRGSGGGGLSAPPSPSLGYSQWGFGTGSGSGIHKSGYHGSLRQLHPGALTAASLIWDRGGGGAMSTAGGAGELGPSNKPRQRALLTYEEISKVRVCPVGCWHVRRSARCACV